MIGGDSANNQAVGSKGTRDDVLVKPLDAGGLGRGSRKTHMFRARSKQGLVGASSSINIGGDLQSKVVRDVHTGTELLRQKKMGR